jgi:transposase
VKGIHQVFDRIPRSRIALETETHSPWVSRQLTQLGHEVIVAHARNLRLIGESSRKGDQLDARTLARLARIDPELLRPMRHRSAKAQIHFTVIRARDRRVIAPVSSWHGWHAFRRELATNLHSLGADGETIQTILKHSTIGLTMNVYVKSVSKSQVSAMDVLSEQMETCNDLATLASTAVN